VAEFGPEVLAADGSLDRARLGEIVFSDPRRRAALEKIVHPYVGRRSSQLMAAAPADAVVVYDVPLLVENGLQDAYDVVVVVEADDDVRLERLAGSRGMAESDARRRFAAQASREQRAEVADVIIDNGGTQARLADQVDALWRRLTSPTART
jgi:dephospho-CoA kinase